MYVGTRAWEFFSVFIRGKSASLRAFAPSWLGVFLLALIFLCTLHIQVFEWRYCDFLLVIEFPLMKAEASIGLLLRICIPNKLRYFTSKDNRFICACGIPLFHVTN